MAEESFWKNRNVFVTGSTGFLGSWLIDELNDRGAVVVGLVRDTTAKRHNSTPMGYLSYAVQGQLEDHNLLLRSLNEYEIDTVFHLGAQPIVGTANRHPLSTFEANIRGTWNLLEACRMVSTVTRVAIASSDKAYGDQPNLPYDENMPLQGAHPYDVSKSCTDLIAQTYHNTYATPVCITRCGNFFGGADLNFNRIVPGTIRSVLNDERPIIRSDGTLIRDYVYVRDVARFYLHLCESMENSQIHGHAFNYSSERQMSVLEITKLILQTLGRPDLTPDIRNESVGEIQHQYLDANKARQMLNWRPGYSIEDAMRETVAWYQEYFATAKVSAA